jgi:glycosyltransferase involved in cell wall biosynthesis
VRVLTLVDAYRLGGAETLIAQLARVSAAADIELSVLSLQGPSDDRSALAPLLQEAGLDAQYLGATRTLDVGAFVRLVRFIKAAEVDVVHTHLELATTLGVPAAALARTPSVSTFHHVHRPLSGRASARERVAVEVASRSAATIFVSQSSLDSFAARYYRNKAVPASWRVVHNGIDLTYYSPGAQARSAFPPDLALGSSRVVTVLAALRDFKGIRHAIDAWPPVVACCPDARLLLVGSGPEEAALRAQVRAGRLEASVVFAGLRSDIPEILRASDVVLLPSIYGENLPTVLMEAGGCARPVVASDVGGISDIVQHGETGLLVPPGDSTGITSALLRLLGKPELADRMGLAARRRMEQRFDAHLWAAALRTVYQDAIGERRPVEVHR